MKKLVWFLLIFICAQVITAKRRHLQDQLQYQLDPLNEQTEYETKDQGKRTLFPARHYMFGKHVAIDSNGRKYLLGYSPLNVKYAPLFKPVAVFRQPIHDNNLIWKPLRQYLPPAIQAPSTINLDTNGWKPIMPVANPIVHIPKPLLVPQQIQPAVENAVIAKPVFAGVQPPLPVHHTPVDLKPLLQPLHNYYFFQTPVVKPLLVPQQQLLQISRPELGVLPLGSAFQVSPHHHIHPPQIHHLGPLAHPSTPIHAPPPPHNQILFHPQHTIDHLHNPQIVHNHHHPLFIPSHQQHVPELNHLHPSIPEHHQPLPQLHHSVSFPVNFPPISVHGNPPNYSPPLFTHNHHPDQVIYGKHFPIANQIPQLPHLPHADNPHPVPDDQPKILFNPAIQPGQSDLQIPAHLPTHPQFIQHINGHAIHPQYLPIPEPDKIIKPGVDLEPPFT
ncbi:extensin-1-like [Photinus pyralis]|nr:extensin-1-like [Photinus pyralis]